jgi:hypothetical protein
MSAEKDVLKRAKHNALKIMKDAGFEISNRVAVTVDPKLPFMGYSTKRNGGDVIVIAGEALRSGTIEGLLIHEMSHIYRTNTKHPSHNHELLNRVVQSIVDKGHLTEDYQITVVQEAVNHVQDLYADDIAFRAFSQSGAFSLDQAFDFFLSWIDDKAVDSKSAKAVWQNIGIMLNNCFALSNMMRHNVPDIRNQAEKKVRKFLSRTSERMGEEFGYFKEFMTHLEENITETAFEKELIDYLTRITELPNQSALTSSRG